MFPSIMWNLFQASNVEYKCEQQLFYLIVLARIQTRDIRLWYRIELDALTFLTQSLSL
jgi:hypothetical protein